MKALSPNAVSFWAFLLCCGVVAWSLHLQNSLGLAPCPLCIIQRLIFLVLALLFLAGALFRHTQKGRRFYYPLPVLVALAGVGTAWRHVWLLKHPVQAAPCSADFLYMFNTLPLSETLRLVFQGAGDCAKQTWAWHGLTMPEWAGVAFAMLAVIAISQMYRRDGKK